MSNRPLMKNALACVSFALTAFAFCAGAEQPEQPAPPAHSPEASSKRPDFGAFSIVVERNIFSRARSQGLSAPIESATAPPSQVVRLIGAWIDGTRSLALLEDGEGKPWETQEPGGTIAGYRIEAIRTDGVTLKNETETIELRVGACLGKGDDGAWHVLESAPPQQPAPAAEPAPGDLPVPPPLPPPPPPDTMNPDTTNAPDNMPERRFRKHMRKEFRQ